MEERERKNGVKLETLWWLYYFGNTFVLHQKKFRWSETCEIEICVHDGKFIVIECNDAVSRWDMGMGIFITYFYLNLFIFNLTENALCVRIIFTIQIHIC